MDQDINLPQLIYSCRTVTRWTQDQLAATIGVKKNTVYRWEHGLATPNPNHLTSLILIFRIESQKEAIGSRLLKTLRALLSEPPKPKTALSEKQRKVMQLDVINRNLRMAASAN